MSTRNIVGVMKGFEGDITEADDAFLDIVGYSRLDFEQVQMNWRQMTPPEYLHLDEAGIQQAAQSGGFTAPYQKEFIRKDGSRVPVLLVCAFIPDTPGAWMGYCVDLSPAHEPSGQNDIIRDVPAVVPHEFYTRLVGELVRERARMVSMLDNTDALIWAIDPSYRLLGGNSAFQAMQSAVSGRTLETGESVLSVDFPQELLDEWKGWYDRALTGERFTVALRNDADYGRLYHAAQLSPMVDPAGVIVGVSVVSQDVTARTNAEAALRASEARFRTLTAASPLGVFLADISGQCVYANPRLCAIYAMSPEEILGSGYVSRIHPDDMPRVMRSWQHATENGYDLDIEYRILLPDGRERHTRSRIVAVHEDGHFTGFVGTSDDETERIALAQRVRQSEKMESLGTLAGGIAHDFNNMLGVVLGFTELAMIDAAEVPAIQQNLEEIRTASLRARDLVRQILSFSRRSDRERAEVDLRAITEESLRLLRPTLPVTLRVEAEITSEPVTVLGDASALQQILVNLCTNAAYAMRGRPDAKLTVRLHSARDGETDKREAILTVSDTGGGIPMTVRDRLFEPFFTTKPPGEGTGMGLAVVHGIVRSHGGTIDVDSIHDVGATFTVAIPLASSIVKELPSVSAAMSEGACVLLVEDEPALGKFAEQSLLRAGFRVVRCQDGAEALRLFENAPNAVDVVLTDVAMPRLTGDRLAKAVHCVRPELPVVLMTGFSHVMSTETLRSLSIASILHKPVSANQLVEAVQHALREAKVERP